MSLKLQGIYRITLSRPDGSTANYVGQSGDLKQRLRAHRFGLRNGAHANRHLQSAWDKFGPDAFVFEIVEAVSDAADLTAAEEWWIVRLGAKWDRGGFNQRIAADSSRGLKKSRESVERTVAHRRGVPLSAEHRAAIGAANKGRKPTDECIRAALKAREGKPHGRLGKPNSPEMRKKMSQTKLNKARLKMAGQDCAAPVLSKGSPKNPNAQKTHCKRGHEFTALNTRISLKGVRECRVCAREWHQARRDGLVARNTVTPEMLGAA